MAQPSAIQLDGNSLTVEQLVRVAHDASVKVNCAPAAIKRVKAVSDRIAGIVRKYGDDVKKYEKSIARKGPKPIMDYGITTGFGEFKRIPIDPARLGELQANILLSHAAGVGETLDEDDLSNYYPPEIVRAVLVLRINTFLKGHSGIRPEVVNILVKMVNRRIIPLVPLRGSVGSSGDLAQLAHLFLVLCEKGRKASRFYQLGLDGQPGPLRESTVLQEVLGVRKIPEPEPKEGLALTNGATFSAAMLALAVHDATSLAFAADIAAAMSAEALLGCARAFDAKVHDARNQRGQRESAEYLRHLLEQSKLLEVASEVQDPYSIRCAPAVHGASRDALEFARDIVERELNAVTDNPLFFRGASSWDQNFAKNWPRRRENRRLRVNARSREDHEEYDGARRHSYSAGNFHGQPIALAADFLSIALAEFANISERRTQLLLDKDHNRGLPANLVPDAGLNSGLMIAQYCAAGLVSENKVLAHPASVDSIPTSANAEDHNAMATIAARKLCTVLANTRHTLAIELLVAAQALEWATLFEALSTAAAPDPQAEHAGLSVDHQSSFNVNAKPKELWERGIIEKNRFAKWTEPANRNTIQEWLGQGTGKAYRAIRESVTVKPVIEDRVLSHDIRLVATLLAPGPDRLAALVAAVGPPRARRTRDEQR